MNATGWCLLELPVKCKLRLGLVRLGPVRLGSVRLGSVRLGPVRLGPVTHIVRC